MRRKDIAHIIASMLLAVFLFQFYQSTVINLLIDGNDHIETAVLIDSEEENESETNFKFYLNFIDIDLEVSDCNIQFGRLSLNKKPHYLDDNCKPGYSNLMYSPPELTN